MRNKLFFLAGAIGLAFLISGCAPKTLPIDTNDSNAGHPVARVVYACDSIAKRVVRYPDTHTAIFPYKGENHQLTLTMSDSGSRYVGDGIVWWSKGSDKNAKAYLYEATLDGETGDFIASCHQIETSRTR